MRPKSVKQFEALSLISLGLGVILSALNWENLTHMAGVAFTLMVQAGTLFIMLALVLLVSRKGSNLARWALVVFFVLGTIMTVPSMADAFAQNPVTAVLLAIQFPLQFMALLLTFHPDAKSWFHKKTASASGSIA